MTDRETRQWVKGSADEQAVKDGCRFDAERGEFVCRWVESYCRLYEGDYAGQPLKLLPWARDIVMRLFGWVRRSERWGREVRRFRQASIWVAKKNGKSPLLAALGLYLLCGDGEMGQKVFLCAKDGQQARKIAGEHAAQMLLQSPELLSECTLNRSTYRISHRPSKSYLEPLSSSNARTQQSKEGINGSVLIDEVHVVDRDFVRRISRAGISRSEPLQIEVSTAGNDPDSYGRERFDYALAVEKGTFTNTEFFAYVCAAPQELEDRSLDDDPLKYGKLANPALGQTVDPEELIKDYTDSKRSVQSLLDFKMYRLNIWQKGSNPWLRPGDWQKCRREFQALDLLGRECWAGLDLSRTRDLSALVLVFRGEEEGTFRLLPWFWLPRQAALDRDMLAPFLQWARDGWLELTPGDVVDYGYIRSRFRELAGQYKIRELAYDPRFAEETTQALEQGILDHQGREVEAGTGVPRFVFAQTDHNFAAPTDDFEALVIAGRLHHNGHPVLEWQAGHAQVIRKITRVKRVVKPDAQSYKTVDGIIAGIMALARAQQAPAGSVYEARGLESVGASLSEEESRIED